MDIMVILMIMITIQDVMMDPVAVDLKEEEEAAIIIMVFKNVNKSKSINNHFLYRPWS